MQRGESDSKGWQALAQLFTKSTMTGKDEKRRRSRLMRGKRETMRG